MTLSPVERLILRNQFLILEKLYPDTAAVFSDSRVIVERGYAFFYDRLVAPCAVEDVGPLLFEEFMDSRAMYEALRSACAKLPDTTGIDPNELQWPGYHPASESHMVRLSQFALKGHPDADAHSRMPMISAYRRMLLVWHRVGSVPPDTLSLEQVRAVLESRHRAAPLTDPVLGLVGTAVPVIDLDVLLRPLGVERHGAGIDMRADGDDASPYQRLRVAHTTARTAERSAAAVTDAGALLDLKSAWEEVKHLGLVCLEQHTKDFQIAAWLTEALVRLDGLPGLAAGADLIAGLLDRYWEDGFPGASDGESAGDEWRGRALPLQALVNTGAFGASGRGTLVMPLYLLPLFRCADGREMCLQDWEAAAVVDGAGNRSLPAGLLHEARENVVRLQQIGHLAQRAEAAWISLTNRLDLHPELGLSGMDHVAVLLRSIQAIARAASEERIVY